MTFDEVVADITDSLADYTGLGIALTRKQAATLLDGIKALRPEVAESEWQARALAAANGAMVDTRRYWTDSDKAAVRAMLEAVIEAVPPRSTRPEAVVSESAWLIEMSVGRWGTGYFWIGVDEYNEWGVIEDAVRFVRKEDADHVIASMKLRKPYALLKLEACEHQWPAPSAVSPTRP